jgi:HEPN domain-containing protein
LTTKWVRKAEADLGMAKRLAAGQPAYPDGVVFHCQQLAEKYLKALLQELGIVFP